MSDRVNGDKADDLQAKVDKRVSEALEAEYKREREEPRHGPLPSYLRRRSVEVSAGVVALVAIVGAILRA